MLYYVDEAEQIKDGLQEMLLEIDEEEPPESEEEDEEESESEATDRMANSLVDQYENEVELISQVQVCFIFMT